MKKLILICLCVSTTLMAADLYNISVHNIERTELQGAFKLTHRNQLGDVVLDCQSFLHGVTVNKGDSTPDFFYLYEPECHEIYQFITDGIQRDKPSCLTLDFTKMVYGLSRSDLDCE